jgi:hypothetical protein
MALFRPYPRGYPHLLRKVPYFVSTYYSELMGKSEGGIVVVNQNWTPNKGSPVGVHTTLLFNEG